MNTTRTTRTTRRSLLAALPLLVAPARTTAQAPAQSPTDPDALVTITTTVRTATGLRRALTTGAPMAGPDVEPLIGRLTTVLDIEG